MPGSVAELLQGWVLSGWSGAGLVPPCSDHQALMSNETLQTRARNILIEISQWSILCLHCVRYWVPITGNAGHYTLHSPAHTRHGDIPSRRKRREPLHVSHCLWDLYVTKLSFLLTLYFTRLLRWWWPDSPISDIGAFHRTEHVARLWAAWHHFASLITSITITEKSLSFSFIKLCTNLQM